MSDSLRRYLAIRQALNTVYEEAPGGQRFRHLNTLASMISGIVGAKSVQLPQIALEMADTSQLESRVMKYRRFVKQDTMTQTTYFQPYIQAFLSGLEQKEFVLSIDTSVVGRGCLCLMISLIYKNRALPLCWSVTTQKKGHLSCDIHLKAIEAAKALLPADRPVTLVGDGEFDRISLIQTLKRYGWHYVLRSAKDALLLDQGAWTCFETLTPTIQERYRLKSKVFFTKEGLVGPLQAIAYWDRAFPDPLFLLTDYQTVDRALPMYQKRAKIETFFSDQKSRGFHLHKSHMSHADRLSRLLIPACLAYIWIVCLGDLAERHGWRRLWDRPNRADISLFQSGLRCLKHLLNQDLPVLVIFHLNPILPQPVIHYVR